MAKVKTACEVEVYEVDQEETTGLSSDTPTLLVASHWNRNEMVTLTMPVAKGKSITVLRSDLVKALENCTNT